MKKKSSKLLATVLALALAITGLGILPEKAQASDNKISVSGSKLSLFIGAEEVVATTVNGSFAQQMVPMFGETCAVLATKSDYKVLGRTGGDGQVEKIYIQPTVSGNTFTLPAMRATGEGAAEVVVLCSTEQKPEITMEERQLTVTIDKYNGTEEAWDGYSFYGDLVSEPPSSKIGFSISDGAIYYKDEEIVSGSTANVTGQIRCTSFSTMDMKEINFGSKATPVDYAFEFVYGQANNNEWDQNQYYELEIDKAKVNAYVNDSLLKEGSYMAGMDSVPNHFKSLWVYDEAAFTVYDCKKDESCRDLLGAVDSLTVMTGGSIHLTSEDDEEITLPSKIISKYYSALGSYKTIDQGHERIQSFTDDVDCVEDKNATGYHPTTNPTPNADIEGRYSFVKANGDVLLRSTCKQLSIIDIENVKNGHFEVEAGSGVMNEKGSFWAEVGTEVKFTLVPDSGFQYKPNSFTFLDMPITDNSRVKKTSTPGVYVYTMGRNAGAVRCEFEPATDTVTATGNSVASGSVDMGQNDLSGSVALSVKDATNVASATKDAITKKADKLTVGTVLDLSLSQVIKSVTNEADWKIGLSELEKKMKVTLDLKDSLKGNSSYEVIRVHKGVTEVIPATYNSKTNSITFETDKYSTYAIAYKKPAPTLKLSASKATLYTGSAKHTKTITATVTGSSKKVSWKSSNKKVATVSSSGKITAVGKGTATITASANGIQKKVTITVKNPTITVKNGKKTITKASVNKKKTITLKVTTNPDKSGLKLSKLSSKDKKYVTATLKNGKLTVKGLKKGSVTLKLTSGKATKSIKITVK